MVRISRKFLDTQNENLRVILQLTQSRTENLANILVASRGFTIAFFTAILGIFLSIFLSDTNQNKDFIYSLLLVSIILELSFWRLFEHYVDLSIVRCYEKIAYCEKKLILPNDFKKIDSNLNLNRGHSYFDFFALLIIAIVSLAFFLRDVASMIFIRYFIFEFFLIIGLTVLAILIIRIKKKHLLENINPSKISTNTGIHIALIILLSGLLLGGVMGFIFSDFFKPNNQKLDDCFDILQEISFRDVGKNEINSMVTRTSYLQKDPRRLIMIGDMIINNFTDPNWVDQRNNESFCYYPKENITFNYCLLKYDDRKSLDQQPLQNLAYMFDKKGKVRQYYKESSGGLKLRTDPYWLAYQKTGECQELSILFNKTANESGFVTRIVRSDGNGHFWNEVNIDGDWKFFDLQQYGNVKDSNNVTQYFGETSDYANTLSWSLCDMIKNGSKPGIFVYDLNNDGYGQNRNEAYDPNHIYLEK